MTKTIQPGDLKAGEKFHFGGDWRGDGGVFTIVEHDPDYGKTHATDKYGHEWSFFSKGVRVERA